MVVELFIKRIKKLHPDFCFEWHEPIYSSFMCRCVVIYSNVGGQKFNMEVKVDDFVISDDYINMIVHRFKAREERLNAQTKK